MNANLFKKNKTLSIVILTMVLLLIVAWIGYTLFGHQQFFIFLISIPLFLIIFSIVLRPGLIITWQWGREHLENHTDTIDALPDSHIGLWIALAAGLGIYTELMIIRLHSSYFQLFAYFKNVSLLSCFLGLGIGYARGSSRPLATPLVLPFLVLQIIFMYILRYTPLAQLLQNPISEQIALGMKQTSELRHIVVVYGFLMIIFAFNALCFVPLGHLASRLMMRKQPLFAYSWNLIGSLAGILLFSFFSFMWLPPSVWIVVAAVTLIAFLFKDRVNLLLSAFAVAIALLCLAIPVRLNQFDVYSPYQILSLVIFPKYPPALKSSNTYYQRILDLREEKVGSDEQLRKWSDYYSLPYHFKPKPEQVLVVGSGMGNDVAAAVRNGAGDIDAVEIDPAILDFGKELHPESPYQARNVSVVVDDARAFIQHTDTRYDLIVYGLLDSHSLLSGRSGGIRLDSYVYTVEGFRAARNRLKEGGVISLSFSLMSPALGRKLFLMLQEAFDGQNPIVYFTGYDFGYTFLAGDGLKKRVLAPPSKFKDVTEFFAVNKIRADKSTDDWPFFYMPVKKYPTSYIILILLLLSLSIVYIRQLLSSSGSSFSMPCFFLGAGFMLVETKGITELALVYGSTWIVTSIVIASILIMAFLANLLVMKKGNPPPLTTYGMLFIALITGLGLTFIDLSIVTPWLNRIIMTGVLTLPLFFSGFAFSTELKRSTSVAVALSSNLLGAMLGGFLEYNSMYFGFRSLYFLALIMYGFAFLGSLRLGR